ncbi:MAG: hypothetical protein AAFS13_08795 [Pseudomonadota bacterium]
MTQATNPQRPLYRVSFSRITGKDDQGHDILARPKEIGAIWARKGDKQGGILDLDIIPTEMVDRKGVLFVVPATKDPAEQKRHHR